MSDDVDTMPPTLEDAYVEIAALRREVQHVDEQAMVAHTMYLEAKAQYDELKKQVPAGKGR